MAPRPTGNVVLVTGASAVGADITDGSQAGAAVRQAVERRGRLDVLVNNAGLMLLVRSSARIPGVGAE
ncbi:SDR family NAD(P)-dependent oxidoreductase [Streptomyces sp. NPDC017993]|uniref:SDR family NAD(P)-dependent oxidoreductase n=1 Tax=Streptomyces sp. NPDC017993 TaxID=3365027 RepID=UPI00378A0160